jgi:hypothetical protein
LTIKLLKHQHHIERINSRLDGMQAAILSAKLPHLPQWRKRARTPPESPTLPQPDRGRRGAEGRLIAAKSITIGIRAARHWPRT